MSKQSLFFFLSHIILATSCVLAYKNHNSRGCIGSAAMCVLKAFRLWDQHACLLVSLTASPLCQPACLFVLKQVLHIVIPPQAPVGEKTWILWLNLKDKVQRGGWHNRRKGPSIQLCPFSLFYLLILAGLSHQSLGVFSSCEFLGLLLWWSDRPLPQKTERVRQCGEWIREVCRVINAQPLGRQARVKTHIAGVTHSHQSLPHLKQSQPPRYAHERRSTLK